ncbi:MULTISPECIES: 4-hydroxybenzoate octaprenyltransferase [Filomicrobium]|nr:MULTISPECIES: 4-hydroxybenzoate octaprenyltransferase [Filomicrobium]MCV0368747.1 4-hydroxybenzoate octaprenyltransferase [Filomicrobium sp.]
MPNNATSGKIPPLDPTVADAVPGNWVDRYAPSAWRPYLRLARADRPIGTWLLLFPCWWSLALAELSEGASYPNPWHLALFAIGAWVMRGAGCAYNDYVDRDFDAQVARTRSRPIPSGQVSPSQALVFVVALSLVGLLVLLQFNALTVATGIASLALVALYPFTKRYTYWPQFVLGLTFNWGALVGWTAAIGSFAWPPLLLYVGSVAWTIAYDTIYAHQDKEDDLMLGLKSTAIRFGEHTRNWLAALFALTVILWTAAALASGGGTASLIAMAIIAAHFIWQVRTLDISDSDNCLERFRANRVVGVIFFAGILAEFVLAALGLDL